MVVNFYVRYDVDRQGGRRERYMAEDEGDPTLAPTVRLQFAGEPSLEKQIGPAILAAKLNGWTYRDTPLINVIVILWLTVPTNVKESLARPRI